MSVAAWQSCGAPAARPRFLPPQSKSRGNRERLPITQRVQCLYVPKFANKVRVSSTSPAANIAAARRLSRSYRLCAEDSDQYVADGNLPAGRAPAARTWAFSPPGKPRLPASAWPRHEDESSPPIRGPADSGSCAAMRRQTVPASIQSRSQLLVRAGPANSRLSANAGRVRFHRSQWAACRGGQCRSGPLSLAGCSPGRAGLGWRSHIDQVVRDARAFFERRLGGTQFMLGKRPLSRN